MEAFVVFTIRDTAGWGAWEQAVSVQQRVLNASVKVSVDRAKLRAGLSPAGNGLKVLHD